MLRTLTTIGLLVAIALPLWDYAMFRPGRRSLAGPRTPAVDRLIEWLGANLAVGGVPNFSFLPRGSRLFFPSGAVLAVMGQNDPCRIAGAEVERHLIGQEGLALRFAAAAKRLRGVVATVDRPGSIRSGETFKLRVPEQWIWQG